jgi:hypothetical protein
MLNTAQRDLEAEIRKRLAPKQDLVDRLASRDSGH